MFHARKRAHKRFHDFAIFCLDYTLVPHAVYPTQLRQAVSALRYLVQAQNRSPRTVSHSLIVPFYKTSSLTYLDHDSW
jgi:hypothetical protein